MDWFMDWLIAEEPLSGTILNAESITTHLPSRSANIRNNYPTCDERRMVLSLSDLFLPKFQCYLGEVDFETEPRLESSPSNVASTTSYLLAWLLLRVVKDVSCAFSENSCGARLSKTGYPTLFLEATIKRTRRSCERLQEYFRSNAWPCLISLVVHMTFVSKIPMTKSW